MSIRFPARAGFRTWLWYALLASLLALQACAGGGGGESAAPSITMQPADQTVAAGATASFSVAASGPATLSYQWQRDSVDIAGATGADYRLTAQPADSGVAFRVRVANAVPAAC